MNLNIQDNTIEALKKSLKNNGKTAIRLLVTGYA
jgi:hypothetical protein